MLQISWVHEQGDVLESFLWVNLSFSARAFRVASSLNLVCLLLSAYSPSFQALSHKRKW